MIPKHIKKILRGLYEVLTLEDLFPHKIRRVIFQMFGSASLILTIVLVFGGEASDLGIRGGVFVCVAITLFLFTLEAYFYSVVVASREKFFVSFEIGELLYYADDDDLTASLLFSDLGDLGMKRLGFVEDDIKDFLISRNHTPFVGVFESVTNHIYARDYFKLIYDNDKDFREFLLRKEVDEEGFVGAMVWEVERSRKIIEKERFWSRDNLSRIAGIGKNWSYGGTYTLDKYGYNLTENIKDFDPVYIKSKERVVKDLEQMLSKDSGSNVIVVSDDEASRIDIVSMFAELVARGKTLNKLQHSRVFLMNPNLMIKENHEKDSFERVLVTVLAEAERAGNVILVIPELSSFIKSATNIGVNLSTIIVPFIHSPHVHIVGLDSKSEYYDFLCKRSAINENFSLLETDNGDNSSLLAMLFDEVEKIEVGSKILVTYPALISIVESIKRDSRGNLRATESKRILVECANLTMKQGRGVLLKSDILSLVSAEGKGTDTSTNMI